MDEFGQGAVWFDHFMERLEHTVLMDCDPLALFGKRLVELSKELGWSQEHLALESGLARSYLGEVERGKRNIALINICVPATTLGVAPSALLDFGEPAKNHVATAKPFVPAD